MAKPTDNFGKLFEDITREILLKEEACVDRLVDQMSGNKGSNNPGDFRAYLYPYCFYIECKSCQADTFAIKSYISENQWRLMLDKTGYPGVFSGYLVWYVKAGCVVWILAEAMAHLYRETKSPTPDEMLQYGLKIPFKISRSKMHITSLLSRIVAGGSTYEAKKT